MSIVATETKAAPRNATETTQVSAASTGASALKRELRGKDFKDGENALAPVQLKGGPGGGAAATSRAAKVGGGKATTAANGGAKPAAPTEQEGAEHAPIAQPEVTRLDAGKKAKLVKDLGKANSIHGVNQLVGGLLGSLAPTPGTSVDAHLKVAVFVEGFYLDVNFDVGAEHTDAGLELSGSMAIGLGVGLGLGAGIAGGKAWAGLQGTLGFNAKGDSGGECLDLIMLGLDRWMRNEKVTILDAIESPVMAILKSSGGGAYLADAIFGGGFEAKVLKSMDPKSKGDEADTLEFSEKLGLDAGADFEAGLGPASLEGSTGTNLRYEQTSTLAKNSKGKLATSTKGGFAGDFDLSLAIGKFKGAGSGSFFRPDGDPKNMQAEFALEIGLPTGVGALAQQAKTLWELWDAAVNKGAGKLGDSQASKAFSHAALAGPRNEALAVLEACGFVSPSVKFIFGIQGKQRTFAIEVVRGADFKKTLGAGAAVALEGDFTMGTKILDKSWTSA